jgi:hypothetical protein
MTLERLREEVNLPEPPYNIDPTVRQYLQELRAALIVEHLEVVRRAINWLLDLGGEGWWYNLTPDPTTGLFPSGTWRIGVYSDGVEFQRYDGTNWVKKLRQGA